MTMNIAVRKVELIEWLARVQDEKLIQRIETLRRGSVKELYDKQMPNTIEELQAKLERAERNLQDGKVHSQEEVERYFNERFK
jgi:hypothetical protein